MLEIREKEKKPQKQRKDERKQMLKKHEKRNMSEAFEDKEKEASETGIKKKTPKEKK